MRVEDLPRIPQSQINNNTLTYVSLNGLPFSAGLTDIASQISGVTGSYVISSQLSGTSGVLNNQIINTGSTLNNKINSLSGNISTISAVFLTGNQLISGNKTFNSDLIINGQLKFGVLNSPTGDFNYFDTTGTGRIFMQAGSALNTNSEAALSLTNQNAGGISNIFNAGFGFTVTVDDNEGELSFLSQGDGHSTLYLYDYYHGGITFVPGNQGGSPSRNDNVIINVNGSLIGDNTNYYGRGIILNAEDNKNFNIGGDIVLAPGKGDAGFSNGRIITSGDLIVSGNLLISGNQLATNNNLQSTGQINYRYTTGLSGLISISHLVYNSGNQTISGVKTFADNLAYNTISGNSVYAQNIKRNNTFTIIDIANQTITDLVVSPGTPSIDWGNRFLSDSSSVTSLIWDTRQTLDNSNVLSIDWQNRILSGINGTSFDWSNGIFYGVDGGNPNTDLVNYQLTKNGFTNIDWSNLQLGDDVMGNVVVDWRNGRLTDNSFVNVLSLDWKNRKALDDQGGGRTSIDWNNRILSGNWNTEKITFNNTGYFTSLFGVQDARFSFGEVTPGDAENCFWLIEVNNGFGGWNKSLYVDNDSVQLLQADLDLHNHQLLTVNSIIFNDGGAIFDSLVTDSSSANSLNWNIRTIYGDWIANDLLTAYKFILSGTAPATMTSAGIRGQIATSGGNLYVCTGTSQWGKIPLVAF